MFMLGNLRDMSILDKQDTISRLSQSVIVRYHHECDAILSIHLAH
jgi:hypothetical protein